MSKIKTQVLNSPKKLKFKMLGKDFDDGLINYKPKIGSLSLTLEM